MTSYLDLTSIMTRPTILPIALSVSLFLFVSACSGSKETESTKSEETAAVDESAEKEKISKFFLDEDAINDAFNELRNMDKFKGKTIRYFNAINFYGDGRIIIEGIQDPEKPENLDEYSYADGKWQTPDPVRLTGEGKLDDNLQDLNKITGLNKIPDMMKITQEKIKDMTLIEPIDFIHFVQEDGGRIGYFSTDVKTERSEYYISFNVDGTLKDWYKK